MTADASRALLRLLSALCRKHKRSSAHIDELETADMTATHCPGPAHMAKQIILCRRLQYEKRYSQVGHLQVVANLGKSLADLCHLRVELLKIGLCLIHAAFQHLHMHLQAQPRPCQSMMQYFAMTSCSSAANHACRQLVFIT